MRTSSRVLAVAAAGFLGACGGAAAPAPVVTVTVTQPGTSEQPTGTPTTPGPKTFPRLAPVRISEKSPASVPNGYRFLMPSTRIGCLLLAADGESSDVAVIRCDITSASWSVPAPASGCANGDWGGAGGAYRAVAIEGRPGRPKVICVSDSVIDPKAAVLDYGSGVRVGPLTCESRASGLRCLSDAGGAFDLSREALVMACASGDKRVVVRNAADPCA